MTNWEGEGELFILTNNSIELLIHFTVRITPSLSFSLSHTLYLFNSFTSSLTSVFQTLQFTIVKKIIALSWNSGFCRCCFHFLSSAMPSLLLLLTLLLLRLTFPPPQLSPVRTVFLDCRSGLSEIRIKCLNFTTWPNLLSICVQCVLRVLFSRWPFFELNLSFCHFTDLFALESHTPKMVSPSYIFVLKLRVRVGMVVLLCMCVCMAWLSRRIQSMSNYGRAKSVGNLQLFLWSYYSCLLLRLLFTIRFRCTFPRNVRYIIII